MTDDLTKKLKEILDTVVRDGKYSSGKTFTIYITEHFDPEHDVSPMIARLNKAEVMIIQAFIDAGWHSYSFLKHLTETTPGDVSIFNGNDQIKRFDGAKLMTGQEWHNKFWNELTKTSTTTLVKNPELILDYVMAASKKASGLTEQ